MKDKLKAPWKTRLGHWTGNYAVLDRDDEVVIGTDAGLNFFDAAIIVKSVNKFAKLRGKK